MPVLAVFIAPLLALYVKFKLVAFGIRIALFMAVYALFKSTMQFVINYVVSRMNALDFPCMITYIINSLDILPMANFALSIWATIYIGKFLLNLMTKVV